MNCPRGCGKYCGAIYIQINACIYIVKNEWHCLYLVWVKYNFDSLIWWSQFTTIYMEGLLKQQQQLKGQMFILHCPDSINMKSYSNWNLIKIGSSGPTPRFVGTEITSATGCGRPFLKNPSPVWNLTKRCGKFSRDYLKTTINPTQLIGL